jgi:hypothetical protein
MEITQVLLQRLPLQVVVADSMLLETPQLILQVELSTRIRQFLKVVVYGTVQTMTIDGTTINGNTLLLT